jgi:hypothetical protein
VHWNDSACLKDDEKHYFYNLSYNVILTPQQLIEAYSAFNPHATFRTGGIVFKATNPQWAKWNPSDPTSPHWYKPDTLRDLIAAYVSQERNGGRVKTVREFVCEFRGLSGTAKQKEVTEGLKGVYLHDLVKDGDIDQVLVEGLLDAMKKASNLPKPRVLGVIGEDHFKAWMVKYASVTEKSIRYVKKLSDADGLPHVLEVAFDIHENEGRRIVTGLNWSPTLVMPMDKLRSLLQEMRVDEHDPVTILVHTARPRFEFVDRGKTRLDI